MTRIQLPRAVALPLVMRRGGGAVDQLSADRVRAILSFGARADAGLGRGWGMIAPGVVLALRFGLAVTRYCGRAW
ncbi:hypothetical protein [Streptomyces sp. NBC_00425]|uniref:hypothetical protein n=1 Tax=Streptomyces sp. NBC_00425 TaxID=2975740 RepID=UPI003FCD2FB1